MIKVAALYCFAPFKTPEDLRQPLLDLCAGEGIRGTLLLAHEGINGTLAGPAAGIDRAVAHIRALPGCARASVKYSRASDMPFHRLKVRMKREIVTMGEPDIDPAQNAGTYVKPADWNALIADPATIVIDTRNDYEVGIGTFSGAIDPETESFREFPKWFRKERERLLAGDVTPKVAMFCTGGIRCEKATAFLKSEGVEDVYHLEGGILKYLEDVRAEESLWQGECFVFDERVSVTHGLAEGTHSLCRACRMPLSVADMESPLYEDGISCARCHDTRTDAQRAGYRERERQVKLAKARGDAHVGAVLPGSADISDGFAEDEMEWDGHSARQGNDGPGA
ncbi:rhodanese-related sulfurtransferase [Pacificimonas sp. WHA3]|uniref:tRNA uridine(34) hydroxylase n=1 Tax=Pacificimonas pallii TaxID=2827236 RepID=A0ABS6SDH4_9SPHN|nr:rhodanese-related sulfurtransferase [Pacificimonas pallii]MBV7255961.1 rhodanese-related sulfurtransferase [Pacificimonas pallii]